MAHGHGQGPEHGKPLAPGEIPNERVLYVGDSRVRKNSNVQVPRDYSAYPGRSEQFVPNFLLKEWMVGAVILVGFLCLIISHPSPLGYPADPNTVGFIPMPDWYFLFLYQFLKYPYVAEKFIVFGSVIIPGIAFGALTLAPFLDTSKERRFNRRPIASALMFVSLLALIYLTNVSWTHYQEELEKNGLVPEHIDREEKMLAGEEIPKSQPGNADDLLPLVAEDDQGYEIYKESTCIACHAADLTGGAGPSLRGIGDKYDKDQLIDIMKNGIGSMPPGIYDQNLSAGLTEEDLDVMAEWLALQKAPGDADDSIDTTPDENNADTTDTDNTSTGNDPEVSNEQTDDGGAVEGSEAGNESNAGADASTTEEEGTMGEDENSSGADTDNQSS